MAPSYYCGFDLGGTKMIALIADAQGKILSTVRADTPGDQGLDAVYDRICTCIDQSISEAGAAIAGLRFGGIGMAVPGLVDSKNGMIVSLTNLGIKDFPIGTLLQKKYGAAVVLENDVNAGVWGEYRFGAARGFNNLAGAFVGTGIGGGLVIEGRLYRGATGSAGEIGHMIIAKGSARCGCGQQGCLEAHCSRLSLSKEAAALAASGKLGDYIKKTGTDIKKFKSSFFAQAFKAGQPDIVDLITTSAFNLGIGLGSLVNILDPEAILLGGGLVEKLGEPYTKLVEASLRKHAMALQGKNVKVITSILGDDAVPLGAACLAMEALA